MTSLPQSNVPPDANRSSRVRRWMTSSLAVVVASLAGTAALASAGGPSRSASSAKQGLGAGDQALRSSPYGVAETVRRIEQTAAAQGLPVLASFAPNQGAGPWVIVLNSSEGGTPVVMDPSQPAPQMPLAVHVREGPEGKALVALPRLPLPMGDGPVPEWPDSVVDELVGLPTIVDLALT